jgi:hypothetical protein
LFRGFIYVITFKTDLIRIGTRGLVYVTDVAVGVTTFGYMYMLWWYQLQDHLGNRVWLFG